MKMHNVAIPLLILIMFFTAPTYVALAQTRNDKPIQNVKEEVQVASSAALDSAAAGYPQYAIKLLCTTLGDLPQDKDYHTYRAFLHFNLGYIYSNYGEEIETNYLSIAAKHYTEALSFQPNDQKILSNLILVLQQNGDDTTAVDYLKGAIRKDSAREGVYYAALGDLYRARGLNDQAWEYYRKATTANPPDAEAGRKLIDLYDELPAGVADRLYAQCKEFDAQSAFSLARSGYGKLLAIYTQAPSVIADASVMRWVAISANLGFVTTQVFSEAELENSQYPPIQELALYLKAWNQGEFPYNVQDMMKWWRQDRRREFHLLAFQKSFGDYLMRNGEHGRAVLIYENVLNELGFKTDFSTEVYGQPDVLVTDVVIALARAYNHPKLNMEGRWKDLEFRLFDMKSQAYQSSDLPSRQKFHTILGQIYFDRGELNGQGYQNAEFQLRNAIDVAERRATKDPTTYYPMPNLHQKLATVYQQIGRSTDALDQYLKAATGYLESDHLRKCDEVLKAIAANPGVNSETRLAKYEMLKSIVTVRTQIPNLSTEEFDPNRQEYFQNNKAYKWLLENSNDDIISDEILIRQRFKVLSDLSDRAAAVGAKDVSTRLAKDARKEMKDVKVLSSQQDVIRMKNLEGTTTQFNYQSDNTPKAQMQRPSANEKTVQIATPPGETKHEVIIHRRKLRRQ